MSLRCAFEIVCRQNNLIASITRSIRIRMFAIWAASNFPRGRFDRTPRGVLDNRDSSSSLTIDTDGRWLRRSGDGDRTHVCFLINLAERVIRVQASARTFLHNISDLNSADDATPATCARHVSRKFFRGPLDNGTAVALLSPRECNGYMTRVRKKRISRLHNLARDRNPMERALQPCMHASCLSRASIRDLCRFAMREQSRSLTAARRDSRLSLVEYSALSSFRASELSLLDLREQVRADEPSRWDVDISLWALAPSFPLRFRLFGKVKLPRHSWRAICNLTTWLRFLLDVAFEMLGNFIIASITV
jgi:hypothetical protein